MHNKSPVDSQLVADKFSWYNNSLTPIAVTDENLEIMYKNDAFTELFGLRMGASFKHLTKSRNDIEEAFEKAQIVKTPVIIQVETPHFPVMFTIAPFQLKALKLFMVFTADFILMDESRNFLTAFDNVTEAKAMELSDIFDKYISPYLDDILVKGYVEDFAFPEQKAYMKKNILRLKMLEFYVFGILRQCAFDPSKPGYALNIRQALDDISKAVDKYAPHGYHLKYLLSEHDDRIFVKDSYVFMSFIICACLHIFRNCGVKNVELYFERYAESISIKISAGLPDERVDFINLRKTKREKEYLKKCAETLGGQAEISAGATEIVLKLRENMGVRGNLVLFDPILEEHQKRVIAQSLDIFCHFMRCLE